MTSSGRICMFLQPVGSYNLVAYTKCLLMWTRNSHQRPGGVSHRSVDHCPMMLVEWQAPEISNTGNRSSNATRIDFYVAPLLSHSGSDLGQRTERPARLSGVSPRSSAVVNRISLRHGSVDVYIIYTTGYFYGNI